MESSEEFENNTNSKNMKRLYMKTIGIGWYADGFKLIKKSSYTSVHLFNIG